MGLLNSKTFIQSKWFLYDTSKYDSKIQILLLPPAYYVIASGNQ